MARIGILGGTFSPFHLGHFALCIYAKRAFALDKVLLIPCKSPVHKKTPPLFSETQRSAMLAAVCNTYSFLSLETYEMRSGLPSITIYTLQFLRKKYKNDFLLFLFGSDAFSLFPSWDCFPEHLNLASFAVFMRGADKKNRIHPIVSNSMATIHKTPSKTVMENGKIFFLQSTLPNYSSTQIRTHTNEKKPYLHMIPHAMQPFFKKQINHL